MDAISPNPQQPRAAVDDDPQLLELAASIQRVWPAAAAAGHDQRDDDHGPRYQLIAGERRWRAARLAGVDLVPVVIREATPELMLEMALVENLQRTRPESAGRGPRLSDADRGVWPDAGAGGRAHRAQSRDHRQYAAPAAAPEEVQDALMHDAQGLHRGPRPRRLADQRRRGAHQRDEADHRAADERARRPRSWPAGINERRAQPAPDRRGGATRAQSSETQHLEQEFTRAVEMKARLQRTTRAKAR